MLSEVAIQEVTLQLEDGLTGIVKLWVEEHQHVATAAFATLSESDINSAFLELISGIRKIPEILEDQKSVAEQISSEIVFFSKVASDMRARGGRISSIIHHIITMRIAMERSIEGCIATDNSKFLVVKRLHRVTDCIETTVLSEFDSENTDQVHNNIQTTCLQIDQAKTTYQSIFESTSNLVLITDDFGHVIEANPAAKIVLADQRITEQFFGNVLQLGDNLDHILERYPPETINEVFIAANGIRKTFNIEIRLLSKSHPLAKGLLIILNDITCAVDHRQVLEQRVVERTRALVKSEKLLNSIFQSVGKGILLLDRDFEIIQANSMACEMYGIPLEVLVGSYYNALTDEQGLKAMSASFEQLEEGGMQWIECTSVYIDGRTFPSSISVTSMHLDDQLFWPIIVWDITRQKELEADIVKQKQQAEEMNVTLRNVLKSIENDKRTFEENLASRIRSSLLPTISRLRQEPDEECRSAYLSVLREQMISLTSDFTAAVDGDLLKLSKTELRICHFIKAGLTGKEICDTMNVSFETIQTHRKNIRKKLDLRGKNINLHTFFADKVL